MNWINYEGYMKDINVLEKEKIYQWSCDNYSQEIEDKYFTKINKDSESYFEKKVYSIEYCHEYTFQTADELRNELLALWKDNMIMEEICQTVIVAAMKNKQLDSDKKRNLKNMEEVKPFIYNF